MEFRKTKSFYQNHQDRLSYFLTKPEADFVKRDKQPHVALAMLLGAKEAAFKASRPAWLGTTPFKDIRVLSSRKRFSSKFSFLKQKKFVIVQCAGIS